MSAAARRPGRLILTGLAILVACGLLVGWGWDRGVGNALLASRLVTDRTGDLSPSETLRHLVRRSVEELNSHPRDQRLYRALYRTFLNPAGTQERAAELLDLPFSTYRAHLRAGTQRVIELLWHQELYGGESSAVAAMRG